jgi:hypothetical protein
VYHAISNLSPHHKMATSVPQSLNHISLQIERQKSSKSLDKIHSTSEKNFSSKYRLLIKVGPTNYINNITKSLPLFCSKLFECVMEFLDTMGFVFVETFKLSYTIIYKNPQWTALHHSFLPKLLRVVLACPPWKERYVKGF